MRAASSTRKDVLRTRANLITAAEKLLTEDREASLTEIAIAAGVSHATIYRHFADRTDLFIALMERQMDRHEAEVAEWDLGPDSFERLLRLLTTEQSRFQGLMTEIRENDIGDARFQRLVGRTEELIRGPLEAAKAAGTVRKRQTIAGTMMLFRMVDGALAAHRERAVRELVAGEAVEVVLAGVRPGAGTKR